MIYLEHPEYGVLAVSRMPKKNTDEYRVITENQYNFALDQIKEQEENNNGTEMPN